MSPVPVLAPMATMQQQETPARSWAAHYASPSGIRRWPCEELVRALGNRKFRGPVVEAGCGNGANLWYLAEHASHVIGIDASQEALDLAGRYMMARGVDSRVSLREGSLLALPLADQSVEAVVDVMAGQHVPWAQQAALLAEYRRVLRPGGWLFRYGLERGTTADGAVPVGPYTVDRLPALFPDIGPFCLAPGPVLARAAAAAGFVDIRTRHVTRDYESGALACYLVLEATA